MTPEQLDEIERGLDGVTPGPWLTKSDAMVRWHIYGDDGYIVATTGPYDSRGERKRPNTRHIARMDPETVRELVRLARIGMALGPDVVIMPKEPTPEILAALGKLWPQSDEHVAEVYRAMLAARPGAK